MQHGAQAGTPFAVFSANLYLTDLDRHFLKPDFYKAGRSLTQRLELLPTGGGGKTAGDLRKLFLRQLNELLVQGFDFFFDCI